MATMTQGPHLADFYNRRIQALAMDANKTDRLNSRPPTEGIEVRSANIDNPLCGDQIQIDIWSRSDRIIALGFDVRGCLLAEASAAVMRQLAIGETYVTLEQRIGELEAFLEGERSLPAPWAEPLDCFTPVQSHPGRHDCMLLPFLAVLVAQIKKD